MDKEKLLRKSILTAHKKSEKDGKRYHVLSDQFYTVVDETYFNEKKVYFSIYNTDDKEYSMYRVEYENGELKIENK